MSISANLTRGLPGICRPFGLITALLLLSAASPQTVEFAITFAVESGITPRAPNAQEFTVDWIFKTASERFINKQLTSILTVGLPMTSGKITVSVDPTCTSPVAFVSPSNDPKLSLSGRTVKLTTFDVVNLGAEIESAAFDVKTSTGVFLNDFWFDKAQYAYFTQPAYLHVYCPQYSSATDQSARIKITPESVRDSTTFNYTNTFGVADKEVQLQLPPGRNLTIYLPRFAFDNYFNLNHTSASPLTFDINAQRYEVEAGKLITATNPSVVSITNPTTADAYVLMRVTREYKLPGWKIAIIVVFSVLGAIALVVGALYIYMAHKRKNTGEEYPDVIETVMDKPGRGRADDPKDSQITMPPQKPSLIDPSMGTRQFGSSDPQDFPELPEDQRIHEPDSMHPAIIQSIEILPHQP